MGDTGSPPPTQGTTMVLAPAFGPLNMLQLEVHEMANSGRGEEALTVAARYGWVARLFGDHKTADFLIQGRMYGYLDSGQFVEAMAAGEELLGRRRAVGDVLGEAKTLGDLAELAVLTGQEGIGYLARAGLLLDSTSRHNDRYFSALCSYGDAAKAAGLYEIAHSAFERGAQYYAIHRRALSSYFERAHLGVLLSWGLRLDQLGHTVEAGIRLRRVATMTADWLAAHGQPDVADARQIHALRALALAKLGDADQAIALAEPVIVALRAQHYYWAARAAHLALGVALRARGDVTAARRELLAAQQLCTGKAAWPDDELIVAHELATLAAQTHGLQAGADLLDAVDRQTHLLWQVRLQRLTMLRQARHREDLEIERAHTQAVLLQDPLTRLGNRRQYDRVAAAIDSTPVTAPTCLLIIDVDKFKTINDTYSHSAGDQVLREIADIMQAHCRAGQDTPIRYAGDEFAIFLQSDLHAAVAVAERIRAAIATTNFDHITPGSPVTISTGAAMLHAGMTAADLFRTADANLYDAKRSGRDRIAA